MMRVLFMCMENRGADDDCLLGPYDARGRCCARYRPALCRALERDQETKGTLSRPHFVLLLMRRAQYQGMGRYDWLALPHNISAAPNEAVVRTFRVSFDPFP